MNKIILLFLSIFTIGASSQAQSLIDVAFLLDDEAVCFIKDDRVIVYDLLNNEVAITATFDEVFPDMPFESVDAAINYGNGKVYLFSGQQYARMELNTGEIDEGYPKSTAAHWDGISYDNIDAAIAWDNGKVYFFNENRYLRYDKTNETVDDGYPKNITDKTWPGLNVAALDAAFTFDEKTYFFKDDQYYRFDVSSDRVDPGYPKNISKWPGLVEALAGENPDPDPNPNPSPSPSGKGVDFFHGSWEETLAKAKANNQLIFVDAYATWCGPCKWMASNTFTSTKAGALYNSYFVNYKFDMERGEGPAFARKYKVRAYPSLFFIDGDGNVVKEVTGAHDIPDFIDLGKEMAKKSTKIDSNADNSNNNSTINNTKNTKGSDSDHFHGSGGN